MATSTIHETVNLYGEPFHRFRQLENFGRQLLDKRCLREWVVSRAVQFAEDQSNLV